MPAVSKKVAATKPMARSRVSNGNKLGNDIDGRSMWARRVRDLIGLYSSDVNPDISAIPEATKSLIRRAAVLTCELERSESGFAEKGEADPAALTAYQTTANSLRRLLDTLNIKPQHQGGHNLGRAARMIENGRLIRDVTGDYTPADWALCYGVETSEVENARATPVVSSVAGRDLSRAIAFIIDRAKREGIPVEPIIAKLAVDAGMAEYADLEVKSDD